MPGGFQCVCPPGFSGIRCEININECASAPCLNNGRCIDGVNCYQCLCASGFMGSNCETNIDECASNPCLHGSCTDQVDGYLCDCEAGWTSLRCESNINECQSSPCLNRGLCYDLVNKYACFCPDGYKGKHCEIDIDICNESVQNFTLCFNGGTCVDGPATTFSCRCPSGFSGDFCEEEINECYSGPCFHGAICQDLVNGYRCHCRPGWTGLHCEYDINECQSEPCFHGICIEKDPGHGYTCFCRPGFVGQNCDHNYNDCLMHTCPIDYHCVDGINSITCIPTEITETTTWNSVINPTSVLPVFTNMEKSTYHAFQFSGTALLQNHQTVTLPVTDSISLISSIPDTKTEVNSNEVLSHGFPMTLSPASLTSTPTTLPPVEDREHLLAFSGLPEETRGLIEPSHIPISPSMLVTTRELDGFSFSPVHIARTEPPWLTHILDSISKSLDGDGTHREDFKTSRKQPFGTPLTSCEICSASTISEDHFSKRPLLESSANETFKISGMFMSTTDWITTYFKISPFSDQFSLNAEISQSEYISSQLLYSGITSHRISITGKMPQPEAYFSTFIKSVLSMPIDIDVHMSNEVHPTVTDVYLLSTDLANAFPLGLDLAKENVFSSEPRVQLSQTVLPFPEQSFLDTFTQFSGTHDLPLKTMESGTSETIDNVMYSSGSKDGNLSSSGQLHWTSTDPFQKGQMSESSAYFSRSQMLSSMDTGHAPNLLDTDTNVSYVHYHGNSFLVFEGISLHAQNNISVRFQSQNPEGTLLYADQGQTAADFFFIKLFIEHGNLQYIFSCKHEERIQSINTTIRVDDGKEYTVYIRQYLTPCEAEVTVSGSPTVRSMPSNNWSGLTNQKTGPLFIGGLPLSYWPNQAAEPIYNFTGCIEVIEINKLSRLFPSNAVGSNNINNCRFSWHKVMPTASMTSQLALINFTPAIIKMPTSALIPTPTAPLPASACQEALCQNGGTCRHVMLQSGATSFQCDCPLHFTGHFCEKDTTLFFPSFNGESYLELPSLTSLVESTDSKVTLSQDTENTVTLYLTVKTSTSHGTILYTREENFGERFLHMLIVDGKPLVKLGCGGFQVLTVWANENINSDRLTPITVQYQLPVGSYGGHCMIEVAVNNNVPSKQKEYLSHRVFEANFGPVFLGNIPSHSELYDGAEKVIGFQGCIRELQMNTKELFIVDEAVRGKNIENCNAPVCQYHPCRNGGVCVSDAENWFCKCPDLYSGKLCQFTACERSPCGHGATCVPKTDQDTVCLCPYGRTGLLCNEAVNVTRPRFSGIDEFGSTSFLAYFTIHNMSFYFEFQLKFTLANNRSAVKDNLIIFTGQKGQGLNGDDFLALGLRKGRIVYKFNLGSGVATILSEPLNLARDIHIIHFGRSLKTGWLKVDDQRNKTGSSPGQLVGLNVFSQFYVGGYNEYTPELLPAGSHFSNGFQGCIFDLQVQTIRNGRFRTPGKPEGHPSAGRSVGQCEDTPCSLVQCKNGGTCIARGSTVYCKCPLEWKGALCTETVSVCDAEHAPPPRCAQGSTCVPTPYGYTCQCLLGTTGMYCEQSLRISDPFFSSNESSWMSFTPFNIRHRTHLRMQFKSLSPDGMLFYTAQHLSPRSGDFFSVSLTHGFVQLRYNLGDKTVILQASDRVDASGKTWYLVHAGRKGNEGYLALDGKTVTQNLTVGMTALDATTDFYVGGVSSLNAISSNAVEDEPVSFTGCIREVIINERELQLTESGAHSGANVGDWDGTACGYKVCKNHGSCNLNRFKQFTCTCPPLWTGSTCAVSVFCADHLCQHHSLCIPNIPTASYSCACSLGWEGKYCEKYVSFLTARFAGNSYIKYTDPYYETRNLKFTKVSVNFTSNASEALILWMGTAENEDDDYLAVGLHNGKLKVAFNLGERISVPLTYNKTLLCCNKWHSVTVIQNRTVIKVYLDDEMVLFEDLDPFERYVALNYGGICYFGGFELHRDITSLTSALFTQGLIGKVKDVILFQDSKNIQFLQSSEGYNVYSGDNQVP
ncbi:protein eyes shut-like protein [Huso huso]|uniref:Protein eyes shut-like protein n=1 Tax=Huso huso TaxID=61971 RepID=A0ABR0ZYG8_HUSHU